MKRRETEHDSIRLRPRDRRQIELDLPNDPEREFVVSVDTAHIRGALRQKEEPRSQWLDLAADNAARDPVTISRQQIPRNMDCGSERFKRSSARVTRAAAKLRCCPTARRL